LWLLLPANADWRWQREREDSPWYPTARLYRQRQPGDWGEPMRRIVGDLRASLMALRAPSWQGWLDQALAHHRQGQLGAAERVYRQVVAAQPEHFDAWHLLGVVAAQQGRHAEAVAHFDHALTLRPDATAYINRASLYERIGRLEDALSDYEMAQALIPAEASLPFRRGNVLLALGRDIDAVSAYDQSLELVADDAEVHFNRGYALRRLNRLDEALTAYGLALTYRPEHVSAYRNRANLLRHLGRREEALADYRHAIDLRPDYARTYAHIAQTLAELGRLEESMCSFDQALKRDPEHAETHLKRAFLRLQMGQFRTGWQEHEWRWRTAHGQAARRDFAQPIWLGDFSLAGRTILLHAEFGLGDTLQFCRYAKQVSALGATVILEAQAPLIGLLSTLDGVDRLVARGDPLPDFDCHCPLMSLPLAFQTDASSIPSATAYLRADPDHMARWTERLGTKRALRIGIVWSGNPKHGDDYKRSLHLADFVRGLPKGAECYGLQKDIRAQDRETLEIYPDIVFLGDQIADFADTAALCELMDVIVSVDTSVAHLAGALGRPLWLLLPFNPDWRWLLDRDDSPWYPSARLFRQPKLGDWPSLLANVREKLQRFANPPGD
jgi:tetratricopeptide (TPR) repeat protein